MTPKNIAAEITQKAISRFGEDLQCVLLYGSVLSENKTPNDLDIIIVLKKRETAKDVSFIKDQIDSYPLSMDIQIINIADIAPESFAHDSHGQFFIRFLQNVAVLFGENPFLQYYPTYSSQLKSVLQKAQYYYFRAKKIQANETVNTTDSSFHRKKLLLMLSDFILVYAGECISHENMTRLSQAVKILTGTLPTKEEEVFLFGSGSLEWGKIFCMYQKYYFAIVDTLSKKVQLSTTVEDGLYRERYSIGSTKLAIIASGCPSHYDESELAQFLAVRGYDAVTFHYSATGKSDGTSFTDPKTDLLQILKSYEPLYETIVLIGNSYGGYPVLNLQKDETTHVQKILAVSPVVRFQEVKNIETLPQFLKDSDPYWYRFPAKEMASFFENAQTASPEETKKVCILHGISDNQIAIAAVESFCDKSNIRLKKINAQHLSLNRLTREHLYALDDLL